MKDGRTADEYVLSWLEWCAEILRTPMNFDCVHVSEASWSGYTAGIDCSFPIRHLNLVYS